MEVREYARYPFVKGASEFVREQGVTLEDLLRHSAFSGARMKGRKRVLDSIDKEKRVTLGHTMRIKFPTGLARPSQSRRH